MLNILSVDALFKSVIQRFRNNRVEHAVMKPREMEELVFQDKQMRPSMLKAHQEML